ncbi:beta-lactamase family protein [Sphingomonas sp. So64.6b]|nr:beta-lactamase family protein [Sphingomonas sp. So64.6b]
MSRRGVIIGLCATPGVALARGRAAKAFTKTGLASVETVLRKHIAAGYAPGLVALIGRGTEVVPFVLGSLEFERERPAQRDSIFRIASMTKPITAVAALMLAERGVFKLSDPVDTLLPELADRKVMRHPDGPLDDVVPAERPITIEDLLTFRFGHGISLDERPTALQQAVSGLPGFGMPDPTSPLTPDAWMKRIGALPLAAQPGSRWSYSTGSDVLGVLIARAAKKPLGEVFRERIFDPLGMSDTGFAVSPAQIKRLATGYLAQDGKLSVFDRPDGAYAHEPSFPEGDSGLVSTATDYMRFARFLMSGLDAQGRRLLSGKSIAAMTRNHLTAEQMKTAGIILGDKGWGYGVGVAVAPTADGLRAGAYGWNGGFGTSWLNDPAADLTAILLTNRYFDGPDTPPIHTEFRHATYAALS